jgi:hypothetical protein
MLTIQSRIWSGETSPFESQGWDNIRNIIGVWTVGKFDPASSPPNCRPAMGKFARAIAPLAVVHIPMDQVAAGPAIQPGATIRSITVQVNQAVVNAPPVNLQVQLLHSQLGLLGSAAASVNQPCIVPPFEAAFPSVPGLNADNINLLQVKLLVTSPQVGTYELSHVQTNISFETTDQ